MGSRPRLLGGGASVAVVPRVLVTRATEDAPALSHALSDAGFQPVEAPAIERVWDLDAVIALANGAVDADVLVVTSGTVADVVAAAVPQAWPNARFAAVGPATAARLEAHGFSVDIVPTRSTAQDLIDALGDIRGLKVAWPHGDLAPTSTVDALRTAGAEVSACVAYRNLEPTTFGERLNQAIPVDATTLLSGSAVRRVVSHVGLADRWKLGRVVVIGPSTHAVAIAEGLDAHAMANPHSVVGLVRALKGLFARAPLR